MKRRRESDASLLIGLVLGIAVGAALVAILSARPDESLNFPSLNTSNGKVEKARASLEEKDKERTEGAAEGAAG
ncbi:MAG: hypothetical protein QOH93_3629 [Chloroflexia bacterium]|jgi:hypothetical protein|nr:hypothetical protein [Chloroflexia bacterium]